MTKPRVNLNRDFSYENVSESEQCEMCYADEGKYLGRLGQYAWYRCAACGWDFPVKAETPERRKRLED